MMPPVLLCWLKKARREFDSDIMGIKLIYRASSVPMQQLEMQRDVT
jgi:hypothetical protein